MVCDVNVGLQVNVGLFKAYKVHFQAHHYLPKMSRWSYTFMIAGVAQKQPWKQTPNVINFPAHYITFPTSPHYKLSIDLKSREGSPRSLQFLSQLDPGAGAPNANAAARLQRPGIQIESWHGMARTSNALPMFNMYPYVQLSKHLATIGRMGNVENQDDPWK